MAVCRGEKVVWIYFGGRGGLFEERKVELVFSKIDFHVDEIMNIFKDVYQMLSFNR